jgi:hypothetical protein
VVEDDRRSGSELGSRPVEAPAGVGSRRCDFQPGTNSEAALDLKSVMTMPARPSRLRSERINDRNKNSDEMTAFFATLPGAAS